MPQPQTILEIEEQGWQALSTNVTSAQKYYQRILHNNVQMIFPGEIKIQGKQQVLQSFDTDPWNRFQIQKPSLLSVTPEVCILSYGVEAQRSNNPVYHALVNSTYTLVQNSWLLIFHQHSTC